MEDEEYGIGEFVYTRHIDEPITVEIPRKTRDILVDFELMSKYISVKIGRDKIPINLIAGDILAITSKDGNTTRLKFAGVYAPKAYTPKGWNLTNLSDLNLAVVALKSMREADTIYWVSYQQFTNGDKTFGWVTHSISIERGNNYYAKIYPVSDKKRQMQEETKNAVKLIHNMAEKNVKGMRRVDFYVPSEEELLYFDFKKYGDYDWLFLFVSDKTFRVRRFLNLLAHAAYTTNNRVFIQVVFEPFNDGDFPTLGTPKIFNPDLFYLNFGVQTTFAVYGYDVSPLDFANEFRQVLDREPRLPYNAISRQNRRMATTKEKLQKKFDIMKQEKSENG